MEIIGIKKEIDKLGRICIPRQKNFGRDIVFSADSCYNGVGDNNG